MAIAGTDPTEADTDGDLLPDGIEVHLTKTLPLDGDSDDDGLSDGNEDANRNGTLDDDETDPASADTDADGVQDGTELGLTTAQNEGTDPAVFVADADPRKKTDPRNPDTDNGGLPDGEEDLNFNGKVDPGETDPNRASDDQPDAADDDRDGVANNADNFPGDANSTQADADGDGTGDVCDTTPGAGCGCGAGPGGSAAIALGARRLRAPASPGARGALTTRGGRSGQRRSMQQWGAATRAAC